MERKKFIRQNLNYFLKQWYTVPVPVLLAFVIFTFVENINNFCQSSSIIKFFIIIIAQLEVLSRFLKIAQDELVILVSKMFLPDPNQTILDSQNNRIPVFVTAILILFFSFFLSISFLFNPILP